MPTLSTPTDEHRQRIIEWCHDHDLDPSDYRDGDVEIDAAGRVHLQRYTRHPNGNLALDELGQPIIEPVAVEPKRPFPAAWPSCLTCGERYVNVTRFGDAEPTYAPACACGG